MQPTGTAMAILSSGWMRVEHIIPFNTRLLARGDPMHDFEERTLFFKPNTGTRWKTDFSLLVSNAIGESTERLEDAWVAFIAAESEAGGHVERHLMSTVWDYACAGPAVLFDHLYGSQVFDESIRERTIELKPVGFRMHSTVAD